MHDLYKVFALEFRKLSNKSIWFIWFFFLEYVLCLEWKALVIYKRQSGAWLWAAEKRNETQVFK